MDLSFTIASHAADTKFHSLPEHTVKHTKRLILDSIGVALAGLNTEECRILLELANEWKGSPQSSIIGIKHAFPAPVAALINGTMIQALDYDDTHDSSGAHVASCVLPAALSVGELRQISGRELILSVALGCDVVGRIGLACHDKIGWTSTSVYGCFGAAIAAAKALRLPQDEIRHALGIVLSQAAGSTQTALDSPLSKHIQAGFAAQAGTVSALMASKGISGIENVFNGKFGFFNLYKSGKYDLGQFSEGLGNTFQVDELSFKPFPSCRATHGPIQAAKEIIEQHGSTFHPAEVQSIEIRIPKVGYELVGGPFNPERNPIIAAQFSAAYTVAATLIHGEFSLNQLSESAIFDRAANELAARAEVVEAYPGNNAFLPAQVIVHTTNDATYDATSTVLKGSAQDPLSEGELMDKFIACVCSVSSNVSAAKARDLGQLILNIDQVSNIRELTALLSFGAEQHSHTGAD